MRLEIGQRNPEICLEMICWTALSWAWRLVVIVAASKRKVETLRGVSDRHQTNQAAARERGLNPDFRFTAPDPNLLSLSDAFIHAGSDARNAQRRTSIRWVKTGRFSYVSTQFSKWISKGRRG
jgi:hypothetical protein